jgi:hypothetical protein
MTWHIVLIDEAAHSWFNLDEGTVVHNLCDNALDDFTGFIVQESIMLRHLHTEFEPSFLQVNRENADCDRFTVLNDIFHVGNIAPHLALVNEASDIGFDLDQGTVFLDVQYYPFYFVINLILQERVFLWKSQTEFQVPVWFYTENDDLKFLTHVNDISGIGDVTPHLALVNKSFESRWEFDKGTIVQDSCDPPFGAVSWLITRNRGIDLRGCTRNFTPKYCILLCFLLGVRFLGERKLLWVCTILCRILSGVSSIIWSFCCLSLGLDENNFCCELV